MSGHLRRSGWWLPLSRWWYRKSCDSNNLMQRHGFVGITLGALGDWRFWVQFHPRGLWLSVGSDSEFRSGKLPRGLSSYFSPTTIFVVGSGGSLEGLAADCHPAPALREAASKKSRPVRALIILVSVSFSLDDG
jgi:hypothetical protein